MATQTHSGDADPQQSECPLGIGAMALAILLAVFLIDGGHNNGQPSAPGGPGNVMRTDQGPVTNP